MMEVQTFQHNSKCGSLKNCSLWHLKNYLSITAQTTMKIAIRGRAELR